MNSPWICWKRIYNDRMNNYKIYCTKWALSSCIGVGRFRILGVPRFRIWGGGANSQQAHDVVTTSMRRNDVASTSFWRRVPIRFLINQCQIITFLILKYDIIENSRIELRGIVLPVQMGGFLEGPKGMLPPPPSQINWGGGGCPLPPLPTPMSREAFAFTYYWGRKLIQRRWWLITWQLIPWVITLYM